jgi:hypothetical protein
VLLTVRTFHHCATRSRGAIFVSWASERDLSASGAASLLTVTSFIKNSENEKSRQSSGDLRILEAAAVSFSAAAKESPSRSWGVAGACVAPALSRGFLSSIFRDQNRRDIGKSQDRKGWKRLAHSSRIVATMSRWLVCSLETAPAGTPGPRTYLLRVISKYGNSIIRSVGKSQPTESFDRHTYDA